MGFTGKFKQTGYAITSYKVVRPFCNLWKSYEKCEKAFKMIEENGVLYVML